MQPLLCQLLPAHVTSFQPAALFTLLPCSPSSLPLHPPLLPRRPQHIIPQLRHLHIFDPGGDASFLLRKHPLHDRQDILQLLVREPRRCLSANQLLRSLPPPPPFPPSQPSTHLLDDKVQGDPRPGPQVIQLQILGLVEPVLLSQRAQQRMRALEQRHRALGVEVRHLLDGVHPATAVGLGVGGGVGDVAFEVAGSLLGRKGKKVSYKKINK